MARPRQKKKQRSSRSTVRTGTAGRTKAGKKKVNFFGNEIIARNWDRKLTLAQNYERLGLSVRLGDRTGGVEKIQSKTNGRDGGEDDEDDEGGYQNKVKSKHSLRIVGHGGAAGKVGQLIPLEVEVERDPETGAILRILGDDDYKENGVNTAKSLNDPLNALDEDELVKEMDVDDDFDADEEDDPAGLRDKNCNDHNIVRQLEAQAAAEEEELVQKKKPRKQSSREEEWIQALVEKYGDDYSGMFRDRKLNPMQQSKGDIKRRVKKWRIAQAQAQAQP